VQPPIRLHISTPGIGVDGERGYNSSHCIGSSRVIGPSPGFLLFTLSRFLALHLPQPLRTQPSYRISFSEGPARACIVLAMPKSRYLSLLRPTASPLPFCAQLRFGLSASRIRPMRECIPRGWTIPITLRRSSVLRNKCLRQSIMILP